MEWINDGYTLKKQEIGRLPMENSRISPLAREQLLPGTANKIKVRIPWTLLYFYDPTQMRVIDGAVSYDGGYNYEISTAMSDGIAVSVYFDGVVTSSDSRYTWPQWLIVPPTVPGRKNHFRL